MSANLNPVSDGASVAQRWYFSRNGQPVGPFEFSALVAMWQNRQIAENAFLFQEGSAGWVPVSEVFRMEAPPPLPRAAPPQTICGKSTGNLKRNLIIAGALFFVMLLALLPNQKGFGDAGQKPLEASEPADETEIQETKKPPFITVEGNLILAKPYEVLCVTEEMGVAIWIYSGSATTPDERAATVYKAGLDIYKRAEPEKEFKVLLALDPELSGAMPNLIANLSSATAEYNRRKFINGKWEFQPHWIVWGAKLPPTTEGISLLKIIREITEPFEFSTSHDVIDALSKKLKIDREEADKRYWQAIYMGLPDKRYDFSGGTR